MKRNKKNFALLANFADELGGIFAARALGRGLRFPKTYSPELKKLLRGLLSNQQVSAIGIGLKTTGSGKTRSIDESALCIQVTVPRKLPMERLPSEFRIQGKIRLDHCARNVTMDVIESRATSVAQATARAGRPTAHNLGPVGALTAIVQAPNGERFGLGCAHVFVPPGIPNPAGSVIESPPDFNPQTVTNPIGVLHTFTPVSTSSANRLDAALIRLDPNAPPISRLPDGSALGPVVDNPDQLRNPIQMFRATTQRWSSGQIRQLRQSRVIFFEGIGGVPFTGLIECEIANAGGDSGSPVVLSGSPRLAVSMHIAGDNSRAAWSIPLISVLSNWNLRLL